ncbi:hypothetical protein T08_10438 [Trichinella sp. T8]|nr:hypothetical protein T08_10438 [Trichinella sp. T8]
MDGWTRRGKYLNAVAQLNGNCANGVVFMLPTNQPCLSMIFQKRRLKPDKFFNQSSYART